MDFLKAAAGSGGKSSRTSGFSTSESQNSQGLVYGKSLFVLYAPDGRRWTAIKEKEYPIKGEDYYYTRLVKQAHHPRMDMCLAKVIDDGGGVISSFVGMVRTAASGRDDRDPNVHYGDKVVVWTDLEGGRYLRATSLVGWLMFCQSKPDIGLDSRGDNVWIVRPGNPDKRGQVHYGDLVVFESARYPGYYISEQASARGKYCRLTNDPNKAPLATYNLGWTPATTSIQGGVIPPFFSAKETDREAREARYTSQQQAAFGAMYDEARETGIAAKAPSETERPPPRPMSGPHLSSSNGATNALQSTMTGYATSAAQQRYSNNPTQFFNDVQSAGSNSAVRGVMSSAAKTLFRSATSG